MLSQTKILEGRTRIWECLFDVIFTDVSTRFGLRSIESYFPQAEMQHIVCSDFQNLRLGTMKLLQKDDA